MEVYWNGVLLGTQIANSTNVTFSSFIVDGVLGINNVRFQEIGTTLDSNGMFLD